MIDREQEQARLLADEMGANGRAGRDLAWIVAITIALTFLGVGTGAVTRGLEWLTNVSGNNLDGALALLVTVPVGSTLYAVRRYRDADAARHQLHDLSYHDTLTGLPNRRFLGDGFDAMLRAARKLNSHVGVFFIDLDGFKRVNDTWGHEIGDQLMVAVADRLRATLGPDDAVVRYGGDEFVAFSADAVNKLAVERIAERLLAAVEAPFHLGEDRLRVSASIGIALTEERCVRADEVLRDADAAMYQAKSTGPGSYALFDRSMPQRFTPSALERELRVAIECGHLRVAYRPIVSLGTGQLVGVEAVLGWDHPEQGRIDPRDFLPALEESVLAAPVGNWLIEQVCRQSRHWEDDFPDHVAPTIKVAVAARHLAQATFVAHLRDTLERTGADPGRISLEVTEAALRDDLRWAWSTLRQAKAMGVSLALDGFGTGSSSLSYLRQFDLDLVRVDRHIVEGLQHSPEDATIAAHLVAMVKSLGIATLAAGVTTGEQVEQLSAMRADLATGDYFGSPQSPEAIARLLVSGASPERTPVHRPITDEGFSVPVSAGQARR